MVQDEIYFPMSANILTVGHIKCLEYLRNRGFVTVGLLTAEAMKGYKQELMPYEDREYILETIAMALGNIDIVPQNSLDPSDNIRKYKCDIIASGDGFNADELRAIEKYKLKTLDIRLARERGKKYSSSAICKKIRDARP